MTGYGRAEGESEGLRVSCEMRSLNGRYLDLDLRLPRFLMEIDPEIRRMLTEKLERGTVTIMYNIEYGDQFIDPSDVKLNESLAAAYYQKLKGLGDKLGLEFRDPFREIIRMQDVISTPEKTLSDEHKKLIVQLTATAANHLVEFRKQEGANTGNKLKDATTFIREQLHVVESNEESRRQGLRERIYGNLQEHVKENISDQSRFEQELLLYLEKWDIVEEKQRLLQHMDYFDSCLTAEPLGRKLNFIAQEMGREMNTLGVKSNHFGMQQAVVLMKEKLEQIKEQVMNLV
ncbi:MAG: YicC family protein [Bacteroidetes bacterium]|nr:YicC family protein [Bacteroidota bacterium]